MYFKLISPKFWPLLQGNALLGPPSNVLKLRAPLSSTPQLQQCSRPLSTCPGTGNIWHRKHFSFTLKPMTVTARLRNSLNLLFHHRLQEEPWQWLPIKTYHRT